MRPHLNLSPRVRRHRVPRQTMRAMVAMVVLSGVTVSPAAWAQTEASPETTQEHPELAWALSRMTILDLGRHESPSTTDYALAANLLSLASDLAPSDNELARSLVQASWLSGDQEMMLGATRRVIRNDPKDTVAQLRLVSSIINKQQTVEGRMRLYERFLGDGGKALDPSVRSRLALDAALLERERGNAQGFTERLHQATTLDISNKAAASLAAQFYAGATDDAVTVLDYQLKLLNADPLDANVHLTIARMLAREGAYLQARRFLNNARVLFTLGTGSPPAMIDRIKTALDWQIDGPAGISKELNTAIQTKRAQAQELIDLYKKRSLPTDDLIQPEQIRYDMETDKIRLFAAYNLKDEQLTRQVLNDIESSVRLDLTAIAQLAGNRGADQQALLREVILRLADLQAMRAIVGLDAERIRADVQQITENQPTMAPYMKSIEPMALYTEGKYEEALAAAEPYRSAPIVNMICALSNEKLGRKEQAIETYLKIMRNNSLSAYSAFARSRVQDLGGEDRVVTTAGHQMMQIVKTVPGWIDQMIERPESFMYLGVSVEKDVYPAISEPMITIKLQNTAPIPMSVGPSQPIDSRMLLIPKFDARGDGFIGKAVPKVVEMDQRLRLRPREEITLRVRADSAQTKWLMGLQANTLLRERYRVLQGFRPRTTAATAQGEDTNPNAPAYGITNSPLGLTAETGLVQLLPLGELSLKTDMLVDQLKTGDRQSRHAAVMAAAGRLLLPAPDRALNPTEQQLVVGALIEAYSHATPDEQAWMMLVLPQRHQVPAMMDFDDHVASSILSDALIDSTVDPVVLTAALLTRTDDPEAPIFETLTQVSEPRVQRVAQILRSRLANGETTLSTLGPGVDAMLPERGKLGF